MSFNKSQLYQSQNRKSIPYLDILTVNSTQNTSNRQTVSSGHKAVQSLLINPTIVPDLSHIDVDHILDVKDSNFFYASGKKTLTLRNQFVKTIQMCEKDSLNDIKHLKKRTHIKTPEKVDTSLIPKPKDKLFYSNNRGNGNLKSLLNGLRENEGKLSGAITTRVGKLY